MGRLVKDLAGQRFHSLTAIERYPMPPTDAGRKKAYWLCLCDCGNSTIVLSQNLSRNNTRSCGCGIGLTLRSAPMGRLNSIYHGIKWRCSDVTNRNYHGRGISICQEWSQSFKTFEAWANTNGYADNLTIDRIDNNKGYSPDNCRWVDMNVQANNKRNSVRIEVDGVPKTVRELSEELSVPRSTIRWRHKHSRKLSDS